MGGAESRCPAASPKFPLTSSVCVSCTNPPQHSVADPYDRVYFCTTAGEDSCSGEWKTEYWESAPPTNAQNGQPCWTLDQVESYLRCGGVFPREIDRGTCETIPDPALTC